MNDVDTLLEKIRCNCAVLSRYHQKRYLYLKSRLKFYRIPILVLSAINSVTAVGLSPYLQQNYVSLLNMSMSLIVGIIGSVELYYGINTQMEIESNGSRDFYILGTDIYKYLSLKDEHKTELSVEFLNTSYNRYIKLVEVSLVLEKKVEDKLSIIDTNQIILPTNTLSYMLNNTPRSILKNTRSYMSNNTSPSILKNTVEPTNISKNIRLLYTDNLSTSISNNTDLDSNNTELELNNTSDLSLSSDESNDINSHK